MPDVIAVVKRASVDVEQGCIIRDTHLCTVEAFLQAGVNVIAKQVRFVSARLMGDGVQS